MVAGRSKVFSCARPTFRDSEDIPAVRLGLLCMDKDVADKNDSSVKVSTRISSYHETHMLSKVGTVRTLKV
jgi:hypothetical protein